MKPPSSETELMDRANALYGRCLGEIASSHDIVIPENLNRAKGWVGELLELVLGATAHSRPVPDFEDIGVELKTLPLNARLEPQESTFVSSAPLTHTVGLSWDDSTVKAKLDRVLWFPVEASHAIPLARRRLGRPLLWSPTAEDSEVLRSDWEEHIERIALGYLDDLDARYGTYLQIRPKALDSHGRVAAHDRDGAPFSTVPRGFYLRTSFTRKILADA